jgi:hypothetical protein
MNQCRTRLWLTKVVLQREKAIRGIIYSVSDISAVHFLLSPCIGEGRRDKSRLYKRRTSAAHLFENRYIYFT